jgi:hypothetical protein
LVEKIDIITFKGKHGNETFAYKNKKGLGNICLKIIRRQHLGGWYDYDDMKKTDPEMAVVFEKAMLENDGIAAYQFIDSRCDYEYEGYDHDRIEIHE